MNNQTVIFAAIRAAVETAGMAIPANLPLNAIPVDGGNVWSAVIPVNEWCDDKLYSPHLFNRDGEKAAQKKDHLKGETTTDIQRTVIACLDSQGVMTKLDGHCRAKAWKDGDLEHPACGTVILFIHVLPVGETSTGVYVQTLLKHAINKAGKLTATEEKGAAQMWAGAQSGFVPKSWFVINSIAKAAIDASKAADVVISKALDVAVKTPNGLGKDLMENLRILQGAREMAEGFGWNKPEGNKVKTDAEGNQVNLTAEERKADRQGKEWTKGASVAAVLLASHNLDPAAALHFWWNYAQPTNEGMSGNHHATKLWKLAYAMPQGEQVTANKKAQFVEEATGIFVSWYQEQWATRKDAIMAEREEEERAKAAKVEQAQEQEAEQAIAGRVHEAKGLVDAGLDGEALNRLENEAIETDNEVLLVAVEAARAELAAPRQVAEQVHGGDVVELDDLKGE